MAIRVGPPFVASFSIIKITRPHTTWVDGKMYYYFLKGKIQTKEP